MIVPAPVFLVLDGELAGERIARIVRAYDGCSLSTRFAELAGLVGRGVDDEAVARWTTNCCTFALGVLAAAGVDYHGLKAPLVNGQEFGVLVALGVSMQAWRDPLADGPPTPGAAIWYRIAGTNDDHVEFLLSLPDEHGGAGRADNAVTVGHGDFHESWGRPIHRWLDPDALGIEVSVPAGTDSEPAAAT